MKAMAPSLPSCISSTFCSHKQASWVVMVTLAPFLLPFLFLSLPFLLLFLAPLSCFLLFWFLLYKVQVSIRRKHLHFLGLADKGTLNKGCQSTQRNVAAEEHCEDTEDRKLRASPEVLPEFEELQDSDAQNAALHTAYEAGSEGILPSSVSDSEGQKQKHTEALPTHDGMTEFEELQGSYAQNAELRAAYEAGGEAIRPSSVSDSEGEKQEHTETLPTHDGTTEGKTEDDGEERMHGGFPEYEEPLHSFVQVVEPPPSYKAPVEVEGSSENIMASTDMQKQLPLYEEATSSPTDTVEEKISTLLPQEHVRQEPELSSDKESSLDNLDFRIRWEETQDDRSSLESFEKGIQAGEPSYSSPEGIAECRKEAFAKETQEDSQPQKDRPAKEIVDSFEAKWPVETDEGHPCETTSSAALPSNLRVHGGIEFQEEEQKILADIIAIKKIVGYQGEPDMPIMEQISAMYMFLGMEPYYWAVEVEYFERARAEIELLKVVVGVK